MANRMFFFIALPGTIICFVAYTMVVFTPNYMTYTAPLPSGMKEGDKVQNYRMGAIQNCTKNGTFHSKVVTKKTQAKKAEVVIVKRSLKDEVKEETEGRGIEESKEVPAASTVDDEEVETSETPSALEEDAQEEGEKEVEENEKGVEEGDIDVEEEESDAKKAGAKKVAKKAEAKKAAKAKGKKTATVKGKATDPEKVTYGKWSCHLLNWKMLTNQIFLAYLSTTAVAWFTLLGAFVVSLIKIILDWVPHDKIKAARILCSRNFGLGLMSAHITAGGFIIASTVLMIVIWKTSLAALGWKLGFNIYLGIGVAVGSFFTAIMWFMDVKKMGLVPI
ncbi:hypothetical protein ACHWQZ_G006313 [Mnemiopsis leidyi]